MRDRVVLDASGLPLHGSGAESPTWWATLAFMLIEGTGFALAIAVYLYLMSLAPEWPLQAPPPDLWAGTSLTLLLIASVVPNILVGRWAQQRNLRRVRIGLVVMTLLGIAPLILRAFEFTTLNIRWDDNAYGSILWMLLGLHTTHILTDVVDTVVLACLMFSRLGDNTRRFGDVEDNCLYWNFVVVAWLPLYGCIYWLARL
ncbi:cytochrome C oxidase subunit III [Xaviernesmea oryzae]|uniref:Cytochrome C oxidase subunit III n=1 Tax=Xaviernesmea oryzae TaxID=464029 RepID=A0A1Q9ARA2_9HYPH|nr:cytochrome c oxidase subunit 3 [Xaviernesmea oryzae]OLP57930.1 cytochrome C oxidase subunit III [Xaviernesmea oryzae]SEL30314.1 Heme/copper-type cytochrome/quinol oxidase, subunit 3 [Xaviernesmea oryzae]